MIYKADLVKEYGITFAQAGTVLGAVDRQALEDKHRSRYRMALWDGLSPINGVPADAIKQRADYPKAPDAVAYFIYRDDRLVYFQYTNPKGASHLSAEDAEVISIEQIEALVAQDVDAESWTLIKREMEAL